MRAILALLLIASAIAGAVFFADHPGRVDIVWQGWRIGTSVGVLAAAVALFAAAIALLALLVAGLRRLPRHLRRRRAERRRRIGEAALRRGLVALAAGQAAEAQLAARRATTLLDRSPVALLLAAEAASRQGDVAAAGRAYSALLDDKETEFLGLRGLLGQALHAGDDGTALRLAERARQLRPDAPWLTENLLVLQGRAGLWEAARDTLAAAARRNALPPERLRHHRGVVLYELSRAAVARGDPRQAAKLAARAARLAPDLAITAAQRARLLLRLGRRRAASRVVEHAWREAPHPDLARLYLEIDADAPPLLRAAALQRLASQNPDAAESHLAIAETALAARLWGEARHHLGQATAMSQSLGPSRRLCLLMARLEQEEAANAQAARTWLDRAIGAPADPCYVCSRCGGEGAEWRPLCPICGAFDTLAWRLPAQAGRALAAPGAFPGTLLMPPAAEIGPEPGGERRAAGPSRERLGDGAAIG